MSMFSQRVGLAWIVALLCLGARAAHAQASPVNYWIPGWPMGFSGAAGEGANAYGNFPSFDFRDGGNGYASARYNFSNGFFVGSQRNTMGFSGLSQSAFGGFGPDDVGRSKRQPWNPASSVKPVRDIPGCV